MDEPRPDDIARPWLKSYPSNIPADIDPKVYGSLGELINQSVAQYGSRVAFANLGQSLTYNQLAEKSRDFGAFLLSSLGLQRGDRVALMMPNVLQYPVALFGALRAGLIVVNVNPLYTPRELEHQLRDSGARAIVVLANFAHTVAQVVDRTEVRHVIVTELGDLLRFPRSTLVNFVVRRVKKLVPAYRLPRAIPFTQALKQGARLPFADAALTHADVAFLQYTGGTTGVAKGAILTHGNLVANLLQARAWLAPHLNAGTEIIITALPLYHIFALTANCLTFFSIGGTNVLITNPRDLPGFVKELARWRVTAITGVNTLFNALLNTPGFDRLDFSALRVSAGGGMAVQRAVAERWKKVTRATLVEMYGLTETSPAACMNPLDLAEYNGSIGLPVPSTYISVRDDQGQEVPAGQPGELWIKGPQVTQGYWHRPDETAKVLTPDGWLKTGDIGLMRPDGFFQIVDRKKDMILVSGFNVYPNEIEDVIASHPGVAEVAAIGIADQKSGEAVKVFVVRKDPNLTEAALLGYCRGQLTSYKVPRYVEFRDSLPKSNVGKIIRRELREGKQSG